MKSLNELFEKEFKNLYALEKQIDETFSDINPSNSKKLLKCTERFKKRNSKDYNTIRDMAQKASINPGNTTDSVAHEMLANISEINNVDVESTVKNAGMVASLNRLASYKTVSYYNVRRMAKALKMKKQAKKFKKIRKKNEAIEEKLKALSRKRIFKKAV